MLQNKKYTTPAGTQYAVFPMEVLAISQGMNGSLSHVNTFNIDIVGSGTGQEWAFAPVDVTVKWVNEKAGNGILFESDNPALLADGTIDFFHFTMIHMNNIDGYFIGRKFKQGERIYQEGTAGNASGNHIDLKVAKGKYPGGYPLQSAYTDPKTKRAHWRIKNEVEPYKVFFVNDTIMRRDFGYPWVEYKTESVVPTPPQPTTPDFKVGDKVKVIGNNYATGQTVPSWVKQNVYSITRLNGDRALLSSINSWVFLKDLEKVEESVAPTPAPTPVPTPTPTPSPIEPRPFKVGDKVQVIGDTYTNGIKVPAWVKKNIYTIAVLSPNIKPDRARLMPINSWVALKDLKKV